MRWFLDMCVILNYIGEGDNKKITDKTIFFINQKKDNKFILCYYIKEDNLPRWLNRKRIIFREVLRQINDNNYIPYSDKECAFLFERDRNQILKIKLLTERSQDKTKIIENFENVYQEIERRISEFLNKYIDEFVIPIKEIDNELKSCLLTWLENNHSDSKTIASAIQAHNKKELVVITADKKDWTKENLEELHNNFDLKKRYEKIPEIKYIQDI